MKFFRLDSSLRTEGSVSRRLADAVEEQWLHRHPDATVLRRDLGVDPLPFAWPAAVSAAMSPADQPRTPEQQAATGLAAELVDELLAADAYVFAVPLYNWNLPAQVKLWIDLITTDPRAGAGNPTPLLAGRPAVLVQARGGGYAPGTPREGWDHATPYLTRILRDHWGLDLSIADAELTLADVNPAMAHLRDAAAQQLTDAHELAGSHGASIAEGLLLSA
ncbi:MAG: NAD(P)H-dependent oxidoreductase [Actinobacteria bacterium]|nr:NAD(P)H-dependent oxidoreductase [Actinomycetota bacterium]